MNLLDWLLNGQFHVGGGTLSVPVWEAVGNSLRTASTATVLALVLGLLVSLVVSRSPRWANPWSDQPERSRLGGA